MEVVNGALKPFNDGLYAAAELSDWFVLQDDPGDFYHFVPTNIFGVAVRF